MEKMKNNLYNIIMELGKISENLYQQRIQEGYDLLNIGLGHIMDLLESVFNIKKNQDIAFDENKMLNNLKLAMDAMEKKDNVLLADILIYDISEQLQELANTLEN